MSQDCGKTFITMRKTPFRTAGMRFPHIKRGCVIVRKRLFRIPEKALSRG
ncbi:unknown [Prevotella sp. CAG:487]|nr:unknown [Prevotella sp. CAG:487]